MHSFDKKHRLLKEAWQKMQEDSMHPANIRFANKMTYDVEEDILYVYDPNVVQKIEDRWGKTYQSYGDVLKIPLSINEPKKKRLAQMAGNVITLMYEYYGIDPQLEHIAEIVLKRLDNIGMETEKVKEIDKRAFTNPEEVFNFSDEPEGSLVVMRDRNKIFQIMRLKGGSHQRIPHMRQFNDPYKAREFLKYLGYKHDAEIRDVFGSTEEDILKDYDHMQRIEREFGELG
jgi:hypothetical protein